MKLCCFLPVCAVILLLALCWKHDLKMPFLTQTYVLLFGYGIEKIEKSQNVKFDTQIKILIIFKYYVV